MVSSCNLRDPYLWAHVYDMIRSDLNFSYSRDYYASWVLGHLIRDLGAVCAAERLLESLIGGAEVCVVGAGPSCAEELQLLGGACRVLVAADGAMRCCLDAGLRPQVVVSDLDGLEPEDLHYSGVVYVVHAHGDNVDRIPRYLREVGGPVIGTAQCLPHGSLRVYGGFTDGDRAAFLAYYFGARSIRLLGFDLSGVVGRYSKPWMRGDSPATPVKLRKLKWAERLLNLLRVCSGDVLLWQAQGDGGQGRL